MKILKVFLAISALGILSLPSSVLAQEMPSADPYTLCSFHPQDASCEAVYQQALKNESLPAARSVRDAHNAYARYLKPPGALSDQDRAWLKDNQIRLPDDLSAADQGGLHNVIGDSTLAGDATARRNAVNNFISRATAAELFCGFNKCSDTSGV